MSGKSFSFGWYYFGEQGGHGLLTLG